MAVERQGQALLAVGRVVGDVADLAEGLGEIVGGVAVVFDDQKAHGDPPGPGVGKFLRRGVAYADVIMPTVTQ